MKQLRDLGNEYCCHDALMQICLEHKPKSYLEIGTCYGDSLMRVLAGTQGSLERVAIADIWQVNYFGAGNNGTQFDQSHKHIERMLAEYDFSAESHLSPNGKKHVTWLDGDSAKTIPTLAKHELFDLVLVDGDHDQLPARTDLFNAWPHVAPGGFLVFDDLQHAQHMAELWHYFSTNATEIAEHHVRTNKKFGVGVAVKTMQYLETSKVRERVLPYFLKGHGIDIGCSRDPITRTCVAFDKSDWPEVTHRGDARALPFHDEEFDWLWSSHCLEDIEDTAATLREWLRVLKPGGMIGIYVPHPELYKGTNTEHRHPGFTPEQIVAYLSDCDVVEAFVDDEPNGPQPRYSTLVIARKR